MAKMYLKSDCKIVDGRIVRKNNIVPLPTDVAKMLDDVEVALQKAIYLAEQPSFQEVPSLQGFKRRHDCKLPFVKKPATPELDKQVEQSLHIMAEIDEVNDTKKVNEIIVSLEPLFVWVASEYVADDGCGFTPIDTPALGNPLKLTEQKLVDAINLICKMGTYKED